MALCPCTLCTPCAHKRHAPLTAPLTWPGSALPSSSLRAGLQQVSQEPLHAASAEPVHSLRVTRDCQSRVDVLIGRTLEIEEGRQVCVVSPLGLGLHSHINCVSPHCFRLSVGNDALVFPKSQV